MRKIPFSKVDKALDKLQRRIFINKLLLKTMDIEEDPARLEEYIEKKRFLERLIHKLNFLIRKNKNFPEILSLDRQKLITLLQKDKPLDEEEWNFLKQSAKVMEEFLKGQESKDDRSLVEEQRKQHINKRIHKKDEWLPL
ncbi:hypothetical protein BN1013_01203 [Candidatus Rubidus massiliensis]|nr:MAG: hypothetical protein BGO10_10875 [Chlamydia sp. 32-24]CDZ80685.1 hypothetical protein BN1013_01203 [Candidatus Rubidus massiliensis]